VAYRSGELANQNPRTEPKSKRKIEIGDACDYDHDDASAPRAEKCGGWTGALWKLYVTCPAIDAIGEHGWSARRELVKPGAQEGAIVPLAIVQQRLFPPFVFVNTHSRAVLQQLIWLRTHRNALRILFRVRDTRRRLPQIWAPAHFPPFLKSDFGSIHCSMCSNRIVTGGQGL
jgi:hypothetical protein